jgi:ferric-dicitrate binding protein FerR (iron transport regulator)
MRGLFLILLAALSVGLACADSKGSVVASVIAIQGKLSVKSVGSAGWSAARVNQSDYPHDHLKTDASSVAALEFVVGGRIGLNKGTEVEITGSREATDVNKGTQLKLTSGSLWAKMSKQKDTFRIATPSCTIGIRGTEFVVEEKSGGTEVSVLEGEVAITDAAAHLTLARPGEVLRILPGKPPIIRLVQLALLRRQLQQRHGPLLQLLENLRINGPPLGPRPGGPRPGPLRRLPPPPAPSP